MVSGGAGTGSLPGGGVAYQIRLRPDLIYAEDPAFEVGAAGARTRSIEAADVAFSLMRLADPLVAAELLS